MSKRLLVAIGFATHAMLGPLCMAFPLEAHASGTMHHHAASHGEEARDCTRCDHDPSDASDCAGHCLSQAKNVSTVSIVTFATGNLQVPPRSRECDDAERRRAVRPTCTAAPLYLTGMATTVMRL